MKKKTVFYIVVLCLIGFLLTCATNPYYGIGNGNGIYYPKKPKCPRYEDDVTTDVTADKYFYFSYDDSASTAAVELVKYSLNTTKTAPNSSLNRAYEFLNYEEFTPTNLTTLDSIFSVSMGVLKRNDLTGDTTDDYSLGVYVKSPDITKTERKNAVITLIVDVSGSMDSYTTQVEEINLTSLEVVKRGLVEMIDYSLKDGDIVNLVKFHTTASILFEKKSYTSDKSFIKSAFQSLTTEGSTNVNEGIVKGYEVAKRTFDANKINRVIILTDAYLNTGELNTTTISQNTKINNMEGIYFSGLGIGSDFNETVLNELTEAGKGAYFSIITQKDAKRAFNEKFIALLNVAARDVKFRLDYSGYLNHSESASEELSTDETAVKSVNFSYNTDQYFFEKFKGTKSDSTAISNGNIKLTIYYKDPVTYEEKSTYIQYKIGDILTRETDNIKSAEAIYLFCKYLGNEINYSELSNIFSAYYNGYSSTLFDEYKNLIDKLYSLR